LLPALWLLFVSVYDPCAIYAFSRGFFAIAMAALPSSWPLWWQFSTHPGHCVAFFSHIWRLRGFSNPFELLTGPYVVAETFPLVLLPRIPHL
jgi:hypothetical protein